MERSSTWLIMMGCAAISASTGLGQPQAKTPPVSAGTTQTATTTLTKADLEEMFAPIALYPDTLLANTLAACVYEDDLKAAAAFTASGGNAKSCGYPVNPASASPAAQLTTPAASPARIRNPTFHHKFRRGFCIGGSSPL